MTLVSEAHTDDVPAGRRVLTTLSSESDTKIIWDPNNADEVANAEETFTKLVGKGFRAFAVGDRGSKAEQIRRFDPSAEKIILSPGFVGG